MTQPDDSSLIAIAMMSITGQRSTRAIADRTTSMIRFTSRPSRATNSMRGGLSLSFELNSPQGNCPVVKQAGIRILFIKAGVNPVRTKCVALTSLHDTCKIAGVTDSPKTGPFGAQVLVSIRNHHTHSQNRGASHIPL